ncbi:hypothetical protein D9M71_208220 [compost metagenome]
MFQRFALVLVVGTHYDLGERRIRQFRPHGHEEARCALADIGRDDPGLLLVGQPGLDLLGGDAGLRDRGAIGHLHLDQHLGSVGDREELFLDQAHAEYRRDEQPDHRTGDQPLAGDDAAQ